MIIGALRKALKDVNELLGIQLTIQIPHDKADLFSELQNKYDEFYELSLENRLVYSGFKVKDE